MEDLSGGIELSETCEGGLLLIVAGGAGGSAAEWGSEMETVSGAAGSTASPLVVSFLDLKGAKSCRRSSSRTVHSNAR